MLRENLTKELPTKHHWFLTENYNWYLFWTTCFFLVKGITLWLNDSKRVLSISGLQISLSLEFSLLAAWLTPGARKTCPTYDTVVRHRRQMFLGFTSLGLNSSWRWTLLDSLSCVLLGVSGGDTVLTPPQAAVTKALQKRHCVWEKDRWHNTHAILRGPRFPGDEGTICVFLKD